MSEEQDFAEMGFSLEGKEEFGEFRPLKTWQVVEIPKVENGAFKFIKKVQLKRIGTMSSHIQESVTVQTDDSVQKVMEAFGKFGVHSIPVIRPAEEGWGGAVVGFIDVLDVVSWFATQFPDDYLTGEKDIETMTVDARTWAHTPASAIINRSHKDLMLSVHEDHSVTEALSLFRKGVHRITLFDDTKYLTGICSQMDVVECIAEQFSQGNLAELGRMSLSELNLDKKESWGGSANVISVLATSPVHRAINKLASTGIQALAVLSPDGHLIGNFSAADLRHLIVDGEFAISLVFLTVEDYLTQFAPNSLNPEVELPSSSFADACKLMASKKIHQVWVVEDPELPNRVPLGVVSLTDVCNVIGGYHPPLRSIVL